MNDEQNYIESLDKKELQAYNIAKNHLGSSFELIKSIGFIKWKKNHQKSSSEHTPSKPLSE
jgi:competence protein ComGC